MTRAEAKYRQERLFSFTICYLFTLVAVVFLWLI